MEAMVAQQTVGAARGFLNPQSVVLNSGVMAGQKVADFGSGHGYFVTEFANAVGEAGHVYAVDVQRLALEAVMNKVYLLGLTNVEPILANLELPGSTALRDESLDLVVISNLLHQVVDQEAVINEAQRIIKPGGALTVVGWIAHTRLAPAGRHLTPDQLNDMALAAGLEFSRSFDCGAYHWGLNFRKKFRTY